MKKKEELKKRLISHDDLYNQVIKIFKNEDQAIRWLESKKTFLRDATPLDLIESKVGKEKVMELLYRIKTGDLS
ncbi:MAG: hypothetical protein ACI88H_001031 [Cocleimonas sp.]|jgi:uncharacterized protein (DUF2384 family)